MSDRPTTTLPIPLPTSFFHNKGAVAGVFAVVGIVVVIIAFVVITSAIRRRRPDFDDYDYTSGNTAGTGYGGYSDGSHGTFAQPPMSHQPGEAYNMSNIPPSQEYLGAAAGAAGIGAGVGAMQRARSHRDPQDPYGAFANREPDQYEMPDSQQLRYRGNTGVPDNQNPSYDLLAAAGLQGVGSDPYALTRGPSQSARPQYPPQPQSQPGVARNPSNRDALSSENHYPSSNTSGQPYGQPPYYQETAPAQLQQQQARNVPAALAPGRVPADGSAYGGYLDTGATMPNPHSPRPNTPPSPVESEAELVRPDAGHLQHIVENDDSQPSLHDEEDYGYDSGRRVLRVANE
ncbi:hypothetical protein EWM64_g5354 [Hericium alpestre]|uniref:Uncharacterized protein n=1 Tax=Hericium alpestre TaxID=135208 RepID=A0A4Y9ZUU1_9AGAM|nr:hypothetical protein EWM64_g5354 [Hericium alpestre]